MNIVALVPARGGSKRVQNKNIRKIDGKPLIAYTIDAASKSNSIQRIIVSTDDELIAETASAYGAECPFLRPPEISGDDSTEFEYHLHALRWLDEHEKYRPDVLVNLYPTTPFRKAETIDKAVERFLRFPDADSLRSVRKCSEHPHKMWVAKEDFLEPFVKKQDSGSHTLSYHLLPTVYIQNASIYITKPETLERYHSTVGEKVISFIMDDIESVDINSELDFQFAEFMKATVI